MKSIDFKKIRTIAFDADDTLWRNEEIFMAAQDTFIGLLLDYHDEVYIRNHLASVQIRNLAHFGYGIKGFTLSMIETAIELTDGRISGREIHEVIKLAKNMVAEPIELLPDVVSVLAQLQGDYQLMVITKGDLLDQEGKLARSGITQFFDHIEIVSDKTTEAYQQILQRYQLQPEAFLMLGNSLKSDVLPVLDIGARAIYVPYQFTWTHEQVSQKELNKYAEIVTLEGIVELLTLLKS